MICWDLVRKFSSVSLSIFATKFVYRPVSTGMLLNLMTTCIRTRTMIYLLPLSAKAGKGKIFIAFSRRTDVGRILRTFKIKKNVEVTDNGKIII